MKNLNVELYSNELLEAWTNKEGLIPAETTLINKYLTDINKSVLEAGTGGGRISFHIEKIGFQKISAFDFAPNMIKRAKETARYYLPYSNQVKQDISFNFRSFMHFLKLRNNDNAQIEIKNIAINMLNLIKNTNVFNFSLKAFGY